MTQHRNPAPGHGAPAESDSAHQAGDDRQAHPAVDWEELRAAARQITARAYVPYSNFPVGAAALTDAGETIVGCNVENASYGVALCAECSLVSALITGGGGRLVAFTCSGAEGQLLMPCGRCRQLLWEHGGPHLLVDTPVGIRPMTEVLPDAFDAEDLTSR